MVPDQRILLVAAEPREFDGLRRFCTGVRRSTLPVHWARSAGLRGRQLWMVANGAGPARAAQAVDAAVPFCQAQAIVSLGFCGALDPALEIGRVFVATRIVSAGREFAVCLPQSDRPHTAGVLVSLDHVAGTASEKRLLYQAGAAAVEMEAAGVATRAAAYGLPLFCVKSVTDTAGESFVTDFNKALRPDGHFGTIRILRSALGNPGAAFPELIRLRHSCRIAARKLGEFIVACRF